MTEKKGKIFQISNINKKDREILFYLDLNARIALTDLARKIRLSPQTTKYRIEQLEKKGIIRGYVTLFNIPKFNHLLYRLYLRYENVNLEEENKIVKYFKEYKNVVWLISTTGRYDLEVLFVARNFIHFNQLLKEVYEKFPDKLHNNVVSVSTANYHHPRSYLVNKKEDLQISYGGEPEKTIFDELDKKIIKTINQNARISSSEIAAKVGTTYKTVQERMKKLEKNGVIQAYRTWIDFQKLGFTYYKAMVKLRKLSKKEENKILEFAKQHPNIIYIVTCVWPWDVEIEFEAENERKFIQILREFRELMGDIIIDYETLTITEEHKLNYCPFAEEL